MKCNLPLLLCLSSAFGATLALAQDASRSNETAQVTKTKDPVAYVYVSGTPKNSSIGEIVAYTTNPDGTLTRVPGSPYSESLSYMAATGSYLFGVTVQGPGRAEYIDSFAIEHNGALRFSTETDLSKYNLGNDDAVSAGIWLDHTGATLYNLQYLIDGANSAYESFAIDKANGSLSMPSGLKKSISNTLSAEYLPTSNISFTANNRFAFSATCFSDKVWAIYGFERHSDGSLTDLPADPPLPAGPGEEGFCPEPFAAADTADHVAFAFQGVINPPFGAPAGSPQLATYTVNTDGNPTTTSTYENMPFISTANVTDLKMSWSGKLLAVGGSGGLQVFHFNGADPITPYTGLLTKDSIDQITWDSSGNLYAVSNNSGKLFVFMTTSAGIKQAPGSPHSISGARYIAVHSLTPAPE
jgi:hypothetical protein